eukprot:1825234-Pleurochrysis_carterae.AAC.1
MGARQNYILLKGIRCSHLYAESLAFATFAQTNHSFAHAMFQLLVWSSAAVFTFATVNSASAVARHSPGWHDQRTPACVEAPTHMRVCTRRKKQARVTCARPPLREVMPQLGQMQPPLSSDETRIIHGA